MAATTTALLVTTDAWTILDDPAGAEFFPPATMYIWINEAVEQIRQARPACLLEDAGTLRTITAVDAPGDIISLDDRWRTAILEWVLFRAFDSDSDDRRDKKQADGHQQQFETALGR